jgi:hypothetical protein
VGGVHLPLRDEPPRQQQRNVFGQRQPESAREQQAEQDEIATPLEPAFDLLGTKNRQPIHDTVSAERTELPNA